jgi:hypothetical protein
MKTSEQLETVEEVSPYTLKVCSTLLMMAYVHNVDPDDLIEFFATQIQTMLTAPPNYKSFGKTLPVWIMRGFYPGTHLFFKLTVVRNDDGMLEGTWAKASLPMVQIGSKRRSDKFIRLSGKDLNQAISRKMENSLLGADHEVKSFVTDAVRRMPRCMSPKGVKIFSCDVPRTLKRAKKNIPDTKIGTDKSKL